jgi:hypothetical protein
MFGSGLLFFMKGKDYYYRFFDKHDKINDKKEDKKNEQKEVKVIKYEDKYWDKYERMLNKEKGEKKDKEEEKKELEGELEEEKKEEEKKEEKDEEKKEDKTKEIEISKNNILFETTPNGNVLMFYDSKRTSFIYYADTAIPYRYLESVARKYVTTYHCLHIYIDMKKEIAEAEKKINDKKLEEKQRLEKKLEEEKIKLEEENDKKLEDNDKKLDKDNKETKEVPRNVFAKLKNYNAGSNTVIKGNKVAETNPNRNATNTTISSKKEYILKENANRFSYEGKMVNYKLLKKPERKVVDKNYGFSFADFKKMQENNK